MDAVIDLDFKRHRDELLASWQARVLMRTGKQVYSVLLSVLAHNFDEALPTLLRTINPNFKSITAPFYCSAAKIDKAGRIVADLVTRDGLILKDSVVFTSQREMRDVFRRLADVLKFDDRERMEFFTALRKWVVADRRLDPTMDPRDPDAKRLVHH